MTKAQQKQARLEAQQKRSIYDQIHNSSFMKNLRKKGREKILRDALKATKIENEQKGSG